LGQLSRKCEVGNRGAETVSTGTGDHGGVSYGCYQLASKLGRPAEFLAAEGKPWRERFAGVEQGSAKFSAVWQSCAKEDAEAFEARQHAYIERTHYAVLIDKVRKETVSTSPPAAMRRDVVWSTRSSARASHQPRHHGRARLQGRSEPARV
jgi:hypothetical protein